MTAFSQTKVATTRPVMNYATLKRGIDIVISALLLILFAPLMLAIALCIKATDGGSILFW